MAEQRAAVDRIEIMRRWLDTTPDGDWVAGIRDPELLERMGAFLEESATADLEVVGLGPDGGSLLSPMRGREGLLTFWQDWLEPWESFVIEVERMLEGPVGVILEVVQRGRLRGSDAVVETPSAAVHFFRGERMSRIEFHLGRDEARRAAGL